MFQGDCGGNNVHHIALHKNSQLLQLEEHDPSFQRKKKLKTLFTKKEIVSKRTTH
uniref:Uncharacterized protein n=1 Tax=Arundo donax TaxID=35708 RepID=A0A0A8XVK5_ARUDO